MIDLPILNPRLSDVISFAESCDKDQLALAVSHLVPEFRARTVENAETDGQEAAE